MHTRTRAHTRTHARTQKAEKVEVAALEVKAAPAVVEAVKEVRPVEEHCTSYYSIIITVYYITVYYIVEAVKEVRLA